MGSEEGGPKSRAAWSVLPTANVLIEDPTHVVEGFSLKFQSTDSNNRDYWILLLRKGLVERMGIPVEESTQPPSGDFMPF